MRYPEYFDFTDSYRTTTSNHSASSAQLSSCWRKNALPGALKEAFQTSHHDGCLGNLIMDALISSLNHNVYLQPGAIDYWLCNPVSERASVCVYSVIVRVVMLLLLKFVGQQRYRLTHWRGLTAPVWVYVARTCRPFRSLYIRMACMPMIRRIKETTFPRGS